MKRLALGLVAAAALLAQQKSILGTVTDFRVAAMQLVVKPDSGAAQAFAIGPDTETLRVPPGETTLDRAKPARLADIAIGDRVLATFVDGLGEARRIVVVTLGDIARRNEQERADWRLRGVSGVVTAKSGDEITLALRTAQAGQTAVITSSAKTGVRRYAAGSVKFTDAAPSAIAEISMGDQAQVRGTKSADGLHIAADDIVFGTFLTKLGTITAVNREAREIEIAEAANGSAWRVRITAETQLKTLPDLRAMIEVASSGGHDAAGHAAASPPDIAQMLMSLKAARMDDLKVGGGVALTSTQQGAASRDLTAIMLLTNADMLVRLNQPAKNGQKSSGMEAFVRMHGGMLGSAGGFTLPAIIP